MLKNYFKIAFRNLLRQKTYSLINIFGLSIGIAACLLILLFIQTELSFENMHRNRDQIYRVLTIDKALGTNNQRVGITMPALGLTIPASIPEAEDALRLTGGNRILLKYEDRVGVYSQSARFSDPNFFDFFNFTLLEGDPATALKEPYTVILTASLAKSVLGDIPPLGQTIKTGDDEDLKITGILQDLPANSHLDFDLLISMSTLAALIRQNQPPNSNQPIWLEAWQSVSLPTYLRLKPDTSPEGLDERLTQLCWDNGVGKNFEITLQPLKDVHLKSSDVIFDSIARKGDLKNLYIFAIIGLLILIIAAVNYMNLSTARSTQRAREVGLRKVSGSGRGQLITQFLGESLLITFIALILSFIITYFAMPWLSRLINVPLSFSLIGNGLVLLFILLTLFTVGILAGLYPAMVLSAFKPVTILKGSFQKGSTGATLRKALVVFQFTLSIAMIGMTAIIQEQLYYIQNKDLGYHREQVLLIDMVEQRMRQNLPLLREELTGHSSIVSVAASGNVPGRTFGRTRIRPEGAPEEDIWIWSRLAVSPETLPTLGIEVVDGRNFSREIRTDSSGVVLVNQMAVKKLGWENALNRRLYFGAQDSVGVRIIGIVKDFHFIGLHQPIEPLVIFPMGSFPGAVLAARLADGRIPEAIEFIEKKWREIYPNHPFVYSFMDDEFDNTYRRDINTSQVVNVFSALAILIACLGLFSLASHSTAMRIKEIGIRKVLGASPVTIARLLVFDFLRWVLLANLFAWPLAWYGASRWLSGFAYRIDLDPFIFIVASIIAILIAFVTVLSQAWHAAISNPVNALKYE
ncbi:MAG: ABC transporter permease [bacterium]|nr:MAG: ABC transporter permease [bacterium]